MFSRSPAFTDLLRDKHNQRGKPSFHSQSKIIITLSPGHRFHDNSSADISSTTLHLQTFRPILYTRVQDSYTSNFCFSKSLFSSIPTSTYTMIPFYQFHFH